MKKQFCVPVRIFVLLLFLSFSSPFWLAASEPFWIRALGGDVVSGPAVSSERIYAFCSDRMVTCLGQNGAFLWRKPIPGKVSSLMTVTSNGTVYAVSGTGTITAINEDGSFLWQLGGTDMPLFAPYEGRDGRVFLVYGNRLVCVSSSAGVLWRLPLTDHPEFHPSETGSGDLLLVCTGNTLLRISPFGELLERIALSDIPTAIISHDSGFAAGFRNGKIQYFDVRNRRFVGEKTVSELLWEFTGTSSCVSLGIGGGTILSIQSDGRLNGLNMTDGALLWSVDSGHKNVSHPFCSWDYGQFNIAFPGYSCALLPSGKTLWTVSLPPELRSLVVSDTGMIYAAGPDWLLYCFSAETRILSEKKAQKNKTYGILNGKSDAYGLPFLYDRQDIARFFDSVTEDLSAGTVGASEPAYARRLSEMLLNDPGDYHAERIFDGTERGRSALLLGQLGSAEYRKVLLDAAMTETDSSAAIGILYGIAALGYDNDGKSFEAVSYLVRSVGMNTPSVQRAACDALYAIARYTGGAVSMKAASEIAVFMQSPYSASVQEYARNVLGNILK